MRTGGTNRGVGAISPSKSQKVSRVTDLAPQQNCGLTALVTCLSHVSGLLTSIQIVIKQNYTAPVQYQDGSHVAEINNQTTLTRD